ncbi:hypothetical protein IWZ00DRAFT_541028 [Phyllosticta capitalensis]|uniref:uncharacterized protein n=1 Tax=Phyllosticta capitalensis TaxID=121624 RepID=UPI0031316525
MSASDNEALSQDSSIITWVSTIFAIILMYGFGICFHNIQSMLRHRRAKNLPRPNGLQEWRQAYNDFLIDVDEMNDG